MSQKSAHRHPRTRTVLGWGKEAANGARLMLAAKTAVAAAIAWYLAPLVPWADSEYSYYAPLGVLVSMYPTLVGSARAGLQALIGLGAGIGLGLGGLALVSTGAPGVVAVAAVIAVGIAVGGISALGTGRDWVAIAGLFVLLIGGPAGDEFTLSYLLTMAFGVVVGVVMNLLVFPPLYLRRASKRLTVLSDVVSEALQRLADTLDGETIDADRVSEATTDLPAFLHSVGEQVREADESSRGNPRGRRRKGDRDLNGRRMHALERTARATQELSDILLHAADQGFHLDAGTRDALAAAVRSCGDLVATKAGDSRAAPQVAVASDALDGAVSALDEHSVSDTSPSYARAHAYAAVVCVSRIVDASREFVDSTE